MVRDRIPITVREWQKPKGVEDNEYVAERYKDGLWNDLMAHFTLPECEEEDDTAALRDKVKVFTLKKMAELFRQWKKTLWPRVLLAIFRVTGAPEGPQTLCLVCRCRMRRDAVG